MFAKIHIWRYHVAYKRYKRNIRAVTMLGTSNLTLAPGTVEIEFDVAPVYNVLTSLYLVSLAGEAAGFDPWVEEVAAALSPARRRTHRIVFDLLYSAYEPDAEYGSFPTYLAHLEQTAPQNMQQRFLRHMFPHGDATLHQSVLADPAHFAAELNRSELDQEVNDDLLAPAHALVADPPALAATVIEHLQTMWQQWMAEEWARHAQSLADTVALYQSQRYPNQNGYDAVKAVTGRSVNDNWHNILARARVLRFIPSPHVGPYLLHINYPPLLRVVFGAQLPRGTTVGPAEPKRLDLLVQLRALADDTRLRIVELLRGEAELCAQDIVARLGLSKSNVSRHLSQLSAAGYLIEEQRAGKVKCYRLNSVRFVQTAQKLQTLPQRQPDER
jgi:ArsR family transcriptional regulator